MFTHTRRKHLLDGFVFFRYNEQKESVKFQAQSVVLPSTLKKEKQEVLLSLNTLSRKAKMLHVTTEIGKPGKQEREKRHFPYIQNQPSVPQYRARGRRYLPHGYGMYDEWKPHPQNIQPEYTEAGPDWKSRLKYLPHPEDPKYPAMEIFENNWKAMRPFPYTYMKTSREWLLDPGLSNKGMKCNFNGQHMATSTSSDEITHKMLYGRGRTVTWIDKRNGITESSPGDKPYKTPEYSSKFHKLGSSLPVIDFGLLRKPIVRPYEEECPKLLDTVIVLSANSPWRKGPDTFVPLQPLPNEPREPFRVKARREEKELERKTVKALDEWRPATPLKPEKTDEKK